jgi:hypothetical protein
VYYCSLPFRACFPVLSSKIQFSSRQMSSYRVDGGIAQLSFPGVEQRHSNIGVGAPQRTAHTA